MPCSGHQTLAAISTRLEFQPDVIHAGFEGLGNAQVEGHTEADPVELVEPQNEAMFNPIPPIIEGVGAFNPGHSPLMKSLRGVEGVAQLDD